MGGQKRSFETIYFTVFRAFKDHLYLRTTCHAAWGVDLVATLSPYPESLSATPLRISPICVCSLPRFSISFCCCCLSPLLLLLPIES
jgi:hypothetical protein